MMRTRIVMVAVAAAALAAGGGASLRAQSPEARAAEVIAAARKALGGEKTIEGLKGLSLRGSYRRELTAPGGGGGAVFVMAGGGGGSMGGAAPQVTGDVEVDFEFPDRFIKVDTSTGMMAMTRTEGFEGDRPFSDVSSSSAGVRIARGNAPAEGNAQEVALRRTQGEAARLLLGMTAGVQPSFPVTYSYVGQAESPDGKADVVDVKGPGEFAARLFVDVDSHLPLMLTYTAPETRVVMRTAQAPGPPAADRHGAPVAAGSSTREVSKEEREELEKEMLAAQATPPKMVEVRVFFADYREVNGVLLPHRISRGTDGKTTEEWEITSYKVNPTFKADRFKVGTK